VQLAMWCKSCGHKAEPKIAALMWAYGADMSVPEWMAGLRCSRCGSREVDALVSGARR
jgi:ribosomal protein L37E